MPITGSDFEKLIQPFFREIFEKMDFLVFQVRKQESGNQNGFDISIHFLDENDLEREILHKNDLLAERNKGYFDAKNIFAEPPPPFDEPIVRLMSRSC